ncbi:MAG TPA: MBL fold metallo-hydrolase [Spirochaetales bacterium]|nr:MBL fold metallo-hydrolase [Spirochaetales bacterium]HRY53474.1 MBL fold metallo-hydrolase [Spirochaetia bacterium]
MQKPFAAFLSLGLLAMPAEAAPSGGVTLTYYGRASVKLRTAGGLVVYVDPFKGDYAEPADLILVTHGHDDHNQVGKVARKPGCVVAAPAGAAAKADLAVVEGRPFEAAGIRVLPVAAYNKNHARGESVGYLIELGGLVVYHSGDSSRQPEMAELASRKIDWALLCTDGYWNMGPAEAAECAALVKAKRSIPIHSSPNGLSDAANEKAFAAAAPGALVVPVGGSVGL